MATNQIQQFRLVSGLLKEHYCKTFVKIPKKAYFHFSHYKSMET